ncbi:MAG: TIGR02594 family protein [Okeania sp. SIO2C9]|uniref:TIGR02594 family protein n=1 Tax=Okeania sp. SIO2C9 TaxID=2607791 RepID=UPI0013C1F0C4|nr:TIGR02594 family protein [Okeania sp. SIO2C9]NEQ73937.1 TIGR02594 family protein [Okeania sp. SIO2C9]
MSQLPIIPSDFETKVIRHRGPGGAWQRTVTLPIQGRFVEESHYATKQDNFPGNGNPNFPESATEGIDEHLRRSAQLYQQYDQNSDVDTLYQTNWQTVWTPPEGGLHGQGSVGNLKPTVVEEMWFMTMMWANANEKPSPGTKFLLSANNRHIVVVAGYETGPGTQEFLGGVTREVHAWLGTDNNSHIEICYLKDQRVPIGPVELAETAIESYQVTAERLNIREDPSLDAAILGTIVKDKIIPDAPKQSDGERTWMKVTLSNLSGWVSMRFLRPVQQQKQRYRVIADLLNVRDRPSLQDSTILGTLKRDEIVELRDHNSEAYWLNIAQINGDLAGYASRKYLDPIGAVLEAFPWFTIALAEEGVREKDPGENTRIVEYLKSTTLEEPYASSDETAWCSCFVNWCVEKAGYAGTDSAWAKSWLHWGKPIEQPQRGCIVVFDRQSPQSSGGHVGFYAGENGNEVIVFGGNQSDSVNYSLYPKDGYRGNTRYRLLGYRLAS